MAQHHFPAQPWVRIEYLDAGDASVATAEVQLGDQRPVAGRGAARRFPTDKSDPEIAELLAVGRALEAAGKKLIKLGNGRVRNADSLRAHHHALKTRAAAKKAGNK